MAIWESQPGQMSLSNMNRPKAYLFDVFGTVVDWRGHITDFLAEQSANALSVLQNDVDNGDAHKDLIERAKAMSKDDWGAITAEWHGTYLKFTRGYVPQPEVPFPTVDDHMTLALRNILEVQGLSGLWHDDKGLKIENKTARHDINTIARVWHYLTPWPDAAEGLELLAGSEPSSKTSSPTPRGVTCTLGNGNLAILNDIRNTFDLRFTDILSAESFRAYKPHPSVYLGAAKKLGLKPEECAMVAAHLGDLKAAKSCGLRTIYVERKDEEEFTEEKVQEAREEGFVDMWIELQDDGLIGIARRLGLK